MKQTKDFYEWLSQQKHRDDPIGDLANDVYSVRDGTEPEELLAYIANKKGLYFTIYRTAEEAIAEFEKKK